MWAVRGKSESDFCLFSTLLYEQGPHSGEESESVCELHKSLCIPRKRAEIHLCLPPSRKRKRGKRAAEVAGQPPISNAPLTSEPVSTLLYW